MSIESLSYQPAFEPGTRIRVVQQVPHVEGVWTTATEGVVVRYRQAKTGSWFAHAHQDRLWLDRLEVRKDDGELVTLNLDRYSVIEELTGS
jgi:hypothetical protein